MSPALVPNLPELAALLEDDSLARLVADSCIDAESEQEIGRRIGQVLEARLVEVKERLRNAED